MPRPGLAFAGIVLCLVLALGGQAATDRIAPGASAAATNKAVTSAASSYLTGLRTFGAAVLWNRIDPLLHGYYSGTSITEQRYMLTSIAVIQALDPAAVQSYYVGSWILANNQRLTEGLEMARRGVDANPQAGLLRVNLAQLLQLYSEEGEDAVAMARFALGDDMVWGDTVERANAYLAAAAVFAAEGETDLEAKARAMSDAVEIDPEDIEGHHHHDD